MGKDFELRAEVAKVDETLGLVMGWAIICKEGDEPYFDTQGDHIPEDAMLVAATDFAKSARVACDMHDRDDQGQVVKAGTVVFIWPMTEDIAKSFKIKTNKTGLMIAMAPEAGMLEKFKTGELTGFSIGGRRDEDEAVEAA